MNEVMQRILAERRERIASERLAAERLRAERRERIATACLAGMIASPARSGKFEEYAFYAVKYADALISRLDKESK